MFDRRGRLWYTASEVNKLGRIERDGTVTEFPVPTADALPLGMTLGPDNALWFTERSAGKIGRFDLRTQARAFTIGAAYVDWRAPARTPTRYSLRQSVESALQIQNTDTARPHTVAASLRHSEMAAAFSAQP